MLACAINIDMTPETPVWMDGMIRSHPSTGAHDPLHAKALAIADSNAPSKCFVIVSMDVCAMDNDDALEIRRAAERQTGIPSANIVLAATHTHSGPALSGLLTPKAGEYLAELKPRLVELIVRAHAGLAPAAAGWAAGREETISHYRRLMADDGHVVMNWEPYSAEHIIGPLGKIDPELLVLRVTSMPPAQKPVALLFNHAGHPNVLSGDNYLISSDYPGWTERLLGKRNGIAMFLNGAQGSVDIDGLKDRDIAGLERTGRALADAVQPLADGIKPKPSPVRGAAQTFPVPARNITDAELAWANGILRQTDGEIKNLTDGVGDDYKARLYLKLHKKQERDITIEQTCVAAGDGAMITFPGEMFTEIGMRIKSESPFRHTAIIGLANGYNGYIPTAKAILEGGYEPDTRLVDATAEEVIVANSLKLLRQVHDTPA